MVETGLLDWEGFARVTSRRPAAIGRLAHQGRPLAEGEPANLILVDPSARWTVDPNKMATMGRNSPFAGLELPGRVEATFYRGHPTVLGGALNAPLTPAAKESAWIG
jgi:dihydroorotase